MDEVLWAYLTGERYLWLAGAAALAGLVRGFSGFGAAMIFIPLASVLDRPEVAVPLLFLVDNVATLHITLPSFRRCCWAEVLPLMAGATLTIPLGVMLLVTVDPEAMRWAISLLILLAVAILASGWRLKRSLPLAGTAAVGGLTGLSGGAASLSGPPLVLFWLGGRSGAAQVRDNIYAIFGLMSVVIGVTLWMNGLLTQPVLREALFLLPVYVLTIVAGARLFRLASEALYRRLALALCALVTLASLPVWQEI